MRSVALLRGVNVGGRHLVPMEALRQVFEAAGCRDVRTYIQSGNVLFTPPQGLSPAHLGAAVEARFGFEVPVVVRTAAELRAVLAANPFLAAGTDSKRLHVGFLTDLPAPERLAGLDPGRWSPDGFAVAGRDVYLHYPNGVARSKMTNAWFDRTLGVVMTVRTWGTVEKLVALAG